MARISLSASLKAKLTAVVLAVLFVSMAAGILIPSRFTAGTLRAQSEEHLASRAMVLGREVEHWLHETTATVQLVAKSPEVRSSDGHRQEPVLRAIRAVYPDTLLIMTTDAHGMNVGRSDGKKLVSYGDRKYLRQVLAGAPLATEVVISKTVKRPVVTVAAPIKDASGAVIGALTSVTELTALSQAVGATKIGETGVAFLVDSDNHLVAHPGKQVAEKLVDFSSDPTVQFLRAHGGGASEFALLQDPRTGMPIPSTEYLVNTVELPNHWGVVVLQQKQEAYAQMTAFVRASSWSMVLALALVGALMWWVISRTLRPVEGLTLAATRLAQGDLTQRISVQSKDELGQLSAAFNSMAASIEAHVQTQARHQVALEQVVHERTAELEERNDEMRLVLDTVEQGLVTVALDGSLGSQRSAAFRRWFPSQEVPLQLDQVLSGGDPSLALALRLGWSSLVEGLLPLELNLDQLPKQIVSDGRKLALAYKPIFKGEMLERVLLVVTDVTVELQRQATDSEQRAFLAVFERVMKDRTGFIEFFNESSTLVSHLAHPELHDVQSLRRELHTLKGNTGIFGVTSVAECCHEVESLAAIEGPAALLSGLARVVQRWRVFAERVTPLIGSESDDIVEVKYQDLDAILAATRRSETHSTVVELVERLRTEPIEVRFRRLAEQIRGLAYRLGRVEPNVILDSGGVRLPREGWAACFSSLIHLLRNTVDHGIEPVEERRRRNKPERGDVVLRARSTGARLVIEIQDDGRGIDWDRVRAKAQDLGLPHETKQELAEALFADGLSTRDEATDLSGRGAGMGAVRDVCRSYGGGLEVESTPGKGTTVRLRMPLQPVPMRGLSLQPAVRPSLCPQGAVTLVM